MSISSLRYARISCAALLTAVAGLSGCTVGPDYRGAPDVAHGAAQAGAFVRAPSAGVTSAGHAPSRWWESLGDPQLNALIDAALQNNSDLHAAQARLRESRAQLQQQRAADMPKVSADAAAMRMREPDLSGLQSLEQNSGNTQNSGQTASTSHGQGPLQLYSAGFDASWEIDLFGGTRRAIEAASAQAEAVNADLADTQVSLAAEVAQAYIDLRSQQQRLVLANQSAQLEQKTLDLIRQQRERGVVTDSDVERQTTQVENTKATLIPLDEQITESLDQLAVLTGQAPGALDSELSSQASLPLLPASVPVDDPATVLKRRPDIRAAERRLAASNAQIGQHEADLFPKVTMLGFIGSNASDPGHLTRKSALTWLGVPYLQWDLMDFGRTRGSIRQAEASRDEAAAHYTQTVLAALQDANNALSRYGHQRESVARLQLIEASADRSATLMRQRYEAGASSLIDLLDTQRVQFSAQQNLVQGRAELLNDFVSLQKSFGLGWASAQ
ncbi:efflux transporter outer membrane subunit [Dyella caseinilytica]|uniref:Efflux transporter outer membrane subunit n=1 Tax=Dyella caseinilytica TaxID=1849581 RepID=A0ABX7H0C1_9GAMM|nr:efflux transporter outer membrane subunit [Dyella caseinilytica]QRN55347.1 efflux transporter outer membrane subunit [Dyella caseinilytica]GGA01068.1 membrane protein [Dyella caseinilytica]